MGSIETWALKEISTLGLGKASSTALTLPAAHSSHAWREQVPKENLLVSGKPGKLEEINCVYGNPGAKDGVILSESGNLETVPLDSQDPWAGGQAL